MIRADRGPFKDNVTSDGTHLHHSVPGIIALIVGAYIGVAAQDDTGWSIVSALLVGVGSSLVLDEFALILHLQDVYWSDEGRISVEMVSLAVGSLGLVLVGLRPFGLDDPSGGNTLAATLLALVVSVPGILVCVDKGKFKLALFGVFIPLVALVGAVRLARPGSRWARRRYGPDDAAAAAARRSRRRPPRPGDGLGPRLRRRPAVAARPALARGHAATDELTRRATPGGPTPTT